MRRALHAEWIKARTMASTGWLLLGAVAATVALSAAATAASAHCRAGGCDPAKTSLTGVQLGQAMIAIVAVLAIGGEYGTGMIRVTLAAMPRRMIVLAAKAAVVAGLVLPTGAAAVAASLWAGRLAPWDDGPVLRAAAGSVLYLALIALLALGTAAAVRDSAAAIGIVLGLLYLFPILATVVSDAHWQRHRRPPSGRATRDRDRAASHAGQARAVAGQAAVPVACHRRPDRHRAGGDDLGTPFLRQDGLGGAR